MTHITQAVANRADTLPMDMRNTRHEFNANRALHITAERRMRVVPVATERRDTAAAERAALIKRLGA